MSSAPVYVPLTSSNVLHVKRALRAHLPDVRSSYLTEALAAAFGRRTHAALLADLSSPVKGETAFARLDGDAFAGRLAQLAGEASLPRSRAGLFHALTYPAGVEVVRTWSPDFNRVRYDTERQRAWRNVVVAAINAGIEQRLFSVRAGDNRWPGTEGASHVKPAPAHHYAFQIQDIPAVAVVDERGFDELLIYVALWPTKHAVEWVDVDGSGFRAGEVHASGWLERRDAAYLQVPQGFQFHCRKARLSTVAALDIEPHCYADRGSFRM